jgi:hypothetical protein
MPKIEDFAVNQSVPLEETTRRYPAITKISYPVSVQTFLTQQIEALKPVASEPTPEFVRTVIETGKFPDAPSIPDACKRHHYISVFIDYLNDVIECMNIIIVDMDELWIFGLMQKGKPSNRLEMLVRNFYAEFYRGREIGRKVFGMFRRHGWASRDEVNCVNEMLDGCFKQFIDSRHAFAHGDAGLIGREFNALQVFESIPKEEQYKHLTAHTPHFIQDACVKRTEALKDLGNTFKHVYEAAAWGLMGERPTWMETSM